MSDTIDNKPKPHTPILGKARTSSEIQKAEHVGYNEAKRRSDIEKVILEGYKIGQSQQPAKKVVVRDAKTGRFVRLPEMNGNVDETGDVPHVILQQVPSNKRVKPLETFASQKIGKTRIAHKVSPKTKTKIEQLTTGVANIATPAASKSFLGEKTPVADDLSDAIDSILDGVVLKNKGQGKSSQQTYEERTAPKGNDEKLIRNTEAIKQAAIVENISDKKEPQFIKKEVASVKNVEIQNTNILKKIEKNTSVSANTLKKAVPSEIEKAKIKNNSRFDDGKNHKKETEGFFQGIANNVKKSPGGKFVKSVSSIFKSKPVEGAEGVAGAPVAAVGGGLLVAGIAAAIIKGLYDRHKENKASEKLGIEPPGVNSWDFQSNEPKEVPESVQKIITQFEGPNKEKSDWSKLSKDQQKQALKDTGVPDDDIQKYLRLEDLKRLHNEIDDPSGTSRIGSLTPRPMQHMLNPGSSTFTSQQSPGRNPFSNYASPGGNGMQQDIMDPNISTEGKALLETIAKPESGGDYNIRQGGGHISDLSQFPQGMGQGGISSASGKYQFIKGTWQEASSALGLKDFSPESQDKAAWWLAQRDYHRHTGGNLSEDVKSKDPKTQMAIAQALHRTWTSMPGGFDAGLGKAGRNGQEYLATLNKNNQKYTELAQKNDNGTKLAEVSNDKMKMQEAKNDQPPIIVQAPAQTVAKSNDFVNSSVPNVRDDNPTILRALQSDIKQA